MALKEVHIPPMILENIPSVVARKAKAAFRTLTIETTLHPVSPEHPDNYAVEEDEPFKVVGWLSPLGIRILHLTRERYNYEEDQWKLDLTFREIGSKIEVNQQLKAYHYVARFLSVGSYRYRIETYPFALVKSRDLFVLVYRVGLVV